MILFFIFYSPSHNLSNSCKSQAHGYRRFGSVLHCPVTRLTLPFVAENEVLLKTLLSSVTLLLLLVVSTSIIGNIVIIITIIITIIGIITLLHFERLRSPPCHAVLSSVVHVDGTERRSQPMRSIQTNTNMTLNVT